MSKNDNLLIYFAGHGKIVLDDGFWLPHDAEEDDDTNWLSNDYLGRKLKNIKADLAKKKAASTIATTAPAGPGSMSVPRVSPGGNTQQASSASSAYSFVPKTEKFSMNPSDTQEQDRTLDEEYIDIQSFVAARLCEVCGPHV